LSERLFVIGSNSFTGASFVDFALTQGAEVIGCSRSKQPASPFLPYAWGNPAAKDKFEFAQLDLNNDTDAMIERIADFKPPYVFNFAAQSMVAESWLYPEHWYQTNVVANVKLHDRLRKLAFIRRYVHVSTPEVYGSCTGQVTETERFNPSTPYAASRAACDLHLMTFFKNYSFPVVFTRAANVYGPGQQLYRIIPRTILFIELGRTLQLHGGGRSVRSFIHASDVADATLRVARNGESGEAYHLSTAEYVSIRSLVETICAKMGVDFDDVVEVVGDRPGKDAAYLLDSTKARENLGWADRISLNDGIDQTIAWVKKNLPELARAPQDYIHKA